MAEHKNLVLTTLATELGVALKVHGFMLTLAESCTGGMVAQAVTSVAGSSAWFDRGFVTYSNAAKVDMLGVLNQTIDTFGAVSEQTAKEMALGALKNSAAHIAASITGIAGPDGGSAEKPVGTVCFAWAGFSFPATAATQRFRGNREEIRHQATLYIVTALIKKLNTLNK